MLLNIKPGQCKQYNILTSYTYIQQCTTFVKTADYYFLLVCLSYLDVAHFWQPTIYLGGLDIFDGIIVCALKRTQRERESLFCG